MSLLSWVNFLVSGFHQLTRKSRDFQKNTLIKSLLVDDFFLNDPFFGIGLFLSFNTFPLSRFFTLVFGSNPKTQQKFQK
jgi:hypothetical protein